MARGKPLPGAPPGEDPRFWDATLDADFPRIEHAEIAGSDEGLLRFLEVFRAYGFTLVHGVPTEPGEVERFANRVAYVREVAFGRMHDVVNRADAYNVALTALELLPHTDLASYHWPPSAQLLHCLANEVTGGESVLVDGFNVAAKLKETDRAAFDLLTAIPATFRIYASDGDTLARAPMIRLDTDGRVSLIRFSNQTMQPLDIAPARVEPFYAAYRKFANAVLDPANQIRFRLEPGDMIVTHGHRVLHGRGAFDPGSGRRHLQDAYMEYDDMIGRIRMLRAKLHGDGVVPGEAAKQAAKGDAITTVR